MLCLQFKHDLPTLARRHRLCDNDRGIFSQIGKLELSVQSFELQTKQRPFPQSFCSRVQNSSRCALSYKCVKNVLKILGIQPKYGLPN